MSTLEILNWMGQAIYDKKGFNILALDVKGLSSITDYILIAEANVDKHGQAIAHYLIDSLKDEGIHLLHAQGVKEGDWIVLDYGEITIHIFCSHDLRMKYAIERLWSESEIIDLSIKAKSSS